MQFSFPILDLLATYIYALIILLWCTISSTFTRAISLSPVLTQFTCATVRHKFLTMENFEELLEIRQYFVPYGILYGVLYLAHVDVLSSYNPFAPIKHFE